MHYLNRFNFLAISFWLAFTLPSYAETLRIGISVPLSGNAEKLGSQFLTGAQLAIAAHNASSSNAVHLITADDGCEAKLGEQSASAMVTTKPILVVGYLCNEPAYEAANRLRDSGLPILIAGAQSERLTKDRERQKWLLWRMSPGDNQLAKKAGEIFSKRWKDQPFAIIDDGTVHGRTLADEFRAAMEEAGQKPQFNDTFRPTQSTQARLVRRLQKAGTTHVFIGASAEDITMIASNANELGISLEIAGDDVLSILPFLPNDKRPPPGLLAVLQLDGNLNPFAANLTEALQERGIEPEPYVYRGYAAMQVAIAAANPSPAEIITKLNTKTFNTVLGPVEFSADGANRISPYALFRWQGESFEKVDP